MSNSGAFRSLHCLIYKVLVPLRSVAEHSLSYHIFLGLSSTFLNFFQSFLCLPFWWRHLIAQLSYHNSFCLSSTFFDFFQNLFRTGLAVGLSFDSLIMLPHLPDFVKPFFRFSRKTFSGLPVQPRPSATARLIYHAKPRLSTPFFKKIEKCCFTIPFERGDPYQKIVRRLKNPWRSK